MSEDHQFFAEPIIANGTLADRVTEILLQKIKTGEVPIHSRLPSETTLAETFAVSRTVVREEISRLKAEGLVETKQGKGTIVVEQSNPLAFQIDMDMHNSLEAILHILEFRRGIEGEMTALAAERRTASQNIEIQAALQAINDAVHSGNDGVSEDFAFHAAISRACGNPLFTSMLEFLSQFLLDTIRVGRINVAMRSDFMGQLDIEHNAIAAAIDAQNSSAARNASNQHLDNLIKRILAADSRFWESEGGKVAHKLSQQDASKLTTYWRNNRDLT